MEKEKRTPSAGIEIVKNDAISPGHTRPLLDLRLNGLLEFINT